VPRSLLQWLGYPRRENLARDLLGWAIEHHGPALLAPIIGVDPGALVPNTLRSEQSFAGRRIDIYFETDAAVVGVEVKILSGEGVGQLRSYAAALQERAEALGVPAYLVFLTESGVVPEQPEIVTAKANRVTLHIGVWDQIAAAMPDGDVLGWKREASQRAQLVAQVAAEFCGDSRLLRLEERLVEDWNLCARGVRALALAAGARVGIPHVHGPACGARGRDVAVDLARPQWAVPLDVRVPGLEPYNPFGDDVVRFTARVRFRITPAAKLQLGVGSVAVPYSPSLPKKLRDAVRDEGWTEFKRARTLGDALARALRGSGRMIDDAWHMDKVLVKTWKGRRDDQAVQALQEAAPVIDEVTRAWAVAGNNRAG
jgi:hypothetical protein